MAEMDEFVLKNVILNERKVIITEDIAFFKHKASELIHKMSLERTYNPECHNDPNKKKCDYCLSCWPRDCSMVHCTRVVIAPNGEKKRGECICSRTDCICLGRYPQ